MRASEITLEPQDALALAYKITPERWNQIIPEFKSNNPTAVAVSEGKVVGKTLGNAIVTGSITVNTRESQDSVNVSVENLNYDLTSARSASGIVIARKTNEIEVGEDYSVQAYVLSPVTAEHPYPYGYSDDNLVIWESSNPSVCRVKNGVLMGLATGSATITAYDLTKSVSDSFTVRVVRESRLSYTPAEVLELAETDIDTTSSETTTTAIQTILSDAHENGYKKVVFPAIQTYFVSPVYGTILVPTQMIVDFNGCVIQIEESAMTTSGGYTMILIKDCDHTEVQNLTLYGERFLISGTGTDGCLSAGISGASKRSGFRNCTISRSPGFNSYFGNTNRRIAGFSLSSIEAGGIGDDGQDIDLDYSFRGNTFINISNIGGVDGLFGLGNMQGYGGYMYMSARVYDIFFYDTNKSFIGSLKNCIQYYRYPKPANAVYCRISYRWGTAPTSSDPDYHAIAHVYSYDMPERCFFKGCTFEDNTTLAITANGGESSTIDGCYFKNNGVRDPMAHIDWEDGRQRNKGHILKNCTLVNNQIHIIGGDGIAIHNNEFLNCIINNGDEAQNSRIWLNQFTERKSNIKTKTDMVFSQNYGTGGASYQVTNVSDVGFAVREAENVFE